MTITFTNKAEYIQAKAQWKAEMAALVAKQKKNKFLRIPANQPEQSIRPDGTVRTPFYIQQKKISDAGEAQYEVIRGKNTINRLTADIVEAKKKAGLQYLAQRELSDQTA
jgi:putative sterol carrier protein